MIPIFQKISKPLCQVSYRSLLTALR